MPWNPGCSAAGMGGLLLHLPAARRRCHILAAAVIACVLLPGTWVHGSDVLRAAPVAAPRAELVLIHWWFFMPKLGRRLLQGLLLSGATVHWLVAGRHRPSGGGTLPPAVRFALCLLVPIAARLLLRACSWLEAGVVERQMLERWTVPLPRHLASRSPCAAAAQASH